MSWNEGVKTFIAAEDLAARRRVKIWDPTITPPGIQYADAEEACIGVTEYGAENGAPIAVKMVNFPGTQEVELDGPVSAGVPLYAIADGKLSGIAGTIKMAEAMESLTAAGRGEVLLLG